MDDSTIDGLLESIIKANNNLTESNDSNNWEQIGRDIEALQALVRQLETARENEKNNTVTIQNGNTVGGNSTVNGQNVMVNNVY